MSTQDDNGGLIDAKTVVHTAIPLDGPVRAAEIYALTNEAVIRFLAAVEIKGRGKCPTCDTDSWNTVFPADLGTVNLLIGNVGGLIGSGAIQCIGLVCSKCGYVKTHSTEPIVKWWRREQAKS